MILTCLYSSCVANWSESIFCCSSKGHFSWPKNFFLKSLWRAHARKEEGKLCGEVVKTRCETIRHNGPVFIWCIKSIYHVETMNLQLFEHYMSKKCNFVREWCGMVQTWNPSWQIWLGGCKMFVCMWVIIFNEWNNFLTVSSISFVSSGTLLLWT